MAIAWMLRDPRVTSALIGASSVAQLEQNVAALDQLDFSDDELAEIDRHAVDSGINLWATSSDAWRWTRRLPVPAPDRDALGRQRRLRARQQRPLLRVLRHRDQRVADPRGRARHRARRRDRRSAPSRTAPTRRRSRSPDAVEVGLRVGHLGTLERPLRARGVPRPARRSPPRRAGSCTCSSTARRAGRSPLPGAAARRAGAARVSERDGLHARGDAGQVRAGRGGRRGLGARAARRDARAARHRPGRRRGRAPRARARGDRGGGDRRRRLRPRARRADARRRSRRPPRSRATRASTASSRSAAARRSTPRRSPTSSSRTPRR